MEMEAIKLCTDSLNELKIETELEESLSTNPEEGEEITIKNVDVTPPEVENDSSEAKNKRRKPRTRTRGWRGKSTEDNANSSSDKDLNVNSSSDEDLSASSNMASGAKHKNSNDEKSFNKEQNTKEVNIYNKFGRQISINLSLMQVKEEFVEVPGEEIVGGLYSRVVIGGDAFLSDYSRFWPSNSKIKPYFLYKNKLSVDELYQKFSAHHYLKNSEKILLLFVMSMHDFVDYAIFLNDCTGYHLFTEYIHDGKKFPLLQCKKYVEKLMDAKTQFEFMGNVTVSFSYFPELKNIRDLRTIFNAVPEDMPNCTCLCKDLGDLPGEFPRNRFADTMVCINRILSIKQVNCSVDKRIFEYMPPKVSFINGNWNLAISVYSQIDDVLLLDFMLRERIYGNDTISISNEAEIKPLLDILRTRIWRYKFRFMLIGDTWIDFISRQWAHSSKIVPFFYFAENLTLTDICNVLISLVRKEEIGLVITSVPTGELFTVKTSSMCKDHKPLEYPVPHENLLKDPVKFANQIITKISKFLKDMKSLRPHCGVVFITCYPVKFASFYNYLSKLHKFHSKLDPLFDIDFSDFDTKVNKCIETINQYIVTSHNKNKLPLCDIYKMVNSSNGDITFPSYIEGKCPPQSIKKELFSCIKNYVLQFSDMCNARKLTFVQTEADQNKIEVSKKRKEIRKRNSIERNSGRNTTGFSSGAELSARMLGLNISGEYFQYKSPLISYDPQIGYSFNSYANNLPLASGLNSLILPFGNYSNSEYFGHSSGFKGNGSFNSKNNSRLSYN